MVNDKIISPITGLQQIIASGSGAVLTALFMTPFDVIKVRLQSQTSSVVRHNFTKSYPQYYKGTFDTFNKIIRIEGFHVLWSGLTPTLCVSIPSVIIYFTSYMKAKQFLGYNEHNPNPLLPVIAGECSRMITVTLVSPFELIRTKIQSENVSYRQLFQLVRTSISNDGPCILWKGLLPTLWRDIPFSMIYWFNYEKFRIYFIRSHTNIDTYATFTCGALAGIIAATITTPADVCKTYQQIELGENKYPTMKQSTRTIWILLDIFRIKGLKGLFTGLIPRLSKVAPACAIMITSFETLKSFFQYKNTFN